jgi:uncharacterized membrane protein
MSSATRALLGIVFTVLLGACGEVPEASGSTSTGAKVGTSPLEADFAAAAAEYQVPVELLKSVAYVETRVTHPGTRPSMTGGFGVMNLVAREDWPALQRGAELTGQDPGRLKLDERANIRAAAAYLRSLAEKSFTEHPDLNPHDPADFWHALSLYPGFEGHGDAQAWAAEVYRTAERGFEVSRPDGTVVVAPTPFDWRRHQPLAQRKDAAKEYPAAYQWQASPNYSTGRTSYEFVLVHTVQGSYSGCISWFKNPSSNVSAHYVVRSSDGQITQMVEHKHVAWHASCYNGRSIGIEHEGYAQDPAKWYTPAMYSESAKLTRWIADRHAIPKTRSRIIGHVEIPSTCNKNAHWDPGSGWNWTHYMNLVNGTTSGGGTTTSGTLKGVIYQNGSTSNVVAGATVTAAGQTKTTGTDGMYSFVLPQGTYTVNVSKSGYTSNSISRTVTAGSTTWGSMEINVVSQKGKLSGVIYQGGSTANKVAGATVTVAGQTMTTGTDGLYEFSLDPGTYTVNVSKTGYSSNSVTRTVTSSTTVWGSMEINPVASSGTLKGAIYQNGNTSDRVSGATVKVGTQTVTTGSDGMYVFTLPPGTYTATASKAGYQNASVTRTVSSNTDVWGSMELKVGTPPPVEDTVPPVVAITFPGDGSAVDYAVLTLTGQASDDKGEVGKVKLSINGGAVAEVAVGAGAFSQQIKLSPGLNHIEVTASDAAGNTSVDTVKVEFRAGIAGFVHVMEDEAARVGDAQVKLLHGVTGEEVGQAVTGADGVFEISLTEVSQDYILVVKAAGFMTRAETVTVPDDERLFLVLPVAEGEDPLPAEVAVEFIEPLDGAVINRAEITVYGSVGGFQVAQVSVNGHPAELVGAGGFAATITLEPGPNTIEAVAVGVGGETLTGSIQVTREDAGTGPAPGPGSGGGTEPPPVKGTCASVPGLELLALLLGAPLLRRRKTRR